MPSIPTTVCPLAIGWEEVATCCRSRSQNDTTRCDLIAKFHQLVMLDCSALASSVHDRRRLVLALLLASSPVLVLVRVLHDCHRLVLQLVLVALVL